MTVDAQTLLRTLQENEPDWAVSWLIEHADPELWAPRQFLIVDELTRGSPSLAATWRAIYRLWLAYKPVNKRQFGLRMIASIGGVGRGHLGGKNGAIKTLHELGLITVIGLDDASDDSRSDRWEYHIDPARLEALSIRLVRSRISAGQLVSIRRPVDAQQHDLFVALDLTPDEAILDLNGASTGGAATIQFPKVAPTGAKNRQVVAPVGTGAIQGMAPTGAIFRTTSVPNEASTANDNATMRFTAPDEATTFSSWHPSVSSSAPIGTSFTPDMTPIGATSEGVAAPIGAELNRQRHPIGLHSGQLSPEGAATPSEVAPQTTMSPPTVPYAEGHVTHDPQRMAPNGAPRSIERSREGLREGSSASPPHSEHAIAEMINRTIALQLPAVIEQVGEAIVARFRPATIEGQPASALCDIPAAPEGEPPLPMPLRAIWEMVSGQPVSEQDAVHIKMLVDRYQKVAAGHSEYWMGRVMLFADMCRKDGEQVKLVVVNSYMKRMSGVTFSTEILEDRNAKGDKAAGVDQPRTPRSRIATRSEEADAAAAPPTPTSRLNSLLSEEVSGHWVVTTWRTFAGTEPVIMPERAQQLVAVVTRQDIWEAVLTNWRTRYGAKANWTHFDGLIETYQREAAAKVNSIAADEFDPDGPPASASVIDNHPSLDADARATWYRRLHAAQGKAEKQAVIKRMLLAHPIESNNP